MDKTNYFDMMQVLCEAHNWKIGDRSLNAFYAQIEGATDKEFEQAFSAGLCATDYYTPAKFVGALRETIVERARSGNVKKLPAGDYRPCPEGLAKIRKLVKVISETKGRKGALAGGRDRFTKIWNEPLTDDELLSCGGDSLANLLSSFAGGVAAPDKYEPEWKEDEGWEDVA